ncbi:MAG: hypothetical protein J5685_06145 [Clostridiales bacterium]|nr:hypothetical protein [Clostridiales bacterium]
MHIDTILIICIAGGIIIGLILSFALSDYLSLLLFSKRNKVKQDDFDAKDYCTKPMQVENKQLLFKYDFTNACGMSLLDDPQKELDYFTKYCSSKKE